MSDSSKDPSPKPALSPEIIDLLRVSLTEWARGEANDEPSLRSALHAVAAAARERGVRAEELLVLLKTTWYEVGGVPAPRGAGTGGNRRLDDAVTACIKAYYG